jgi:hypothetical protein
MLQEKYLPTYHFSQKHSIIIHKPPEEIFPLVDHLDFSKVFLIRLLFFLRGMPAQMMNKQGLSTGNFIELEKIQNEEMIIGLIGQFWKLNGNLQSFHPSEFKSFNSHDFLKATWSFKLISQSPTSTKLETETRVMCLGNAAFKKFSRYWFLIHPFSGLIRKHILKSIKAKAESGE